MVFVDLDNGSASSHCGKAYTALSIRGSECKGTGLCNSHCVATLDVLLEGNKIPVLAINCTYLQHVIYFEFNKKR